MLPASYPIKSATAKDTWRLNFSIVLSAAPVLQVSSVFSSLPALMVLPVSPSVQWADGDVSDLVTLVPQWKVKLGSSGEPSLCRYEPIESM